MGTTVDDVLVCLMSMGFDLKDGQDAIQFGKVTVEEAVEWIVAGKPGFALTQQPPPSLKLYKDNSQAPNPVQATDSHHTPREPLQQSEVAHDPGGSLTHGTDEESAVISRMHLDDRQRKVKESFEHKQREEAKKNAQIEKRRQKQDHARILKEIAEDREKQKMKIKPTTCHVGSSPPLPSTDVAASSPSPKSQSDKCLIQIRLPDGRMVRQQFSSTASLRDVWNFISHRVTNIHSMVLIQPFPRREYSENDMKSTLADLGLSPSGSLVLQRKENIQSTARQMEVPAAPDLLEQVAALQPEEGPGQYAMGWGRGHALDENMEEEREDNQDRAGEDDDDEDEGMENQFMDQMGHMFPQRMRGRFGGGFAGPGMLDAASFQGLGQRLVAMGDPQFNEAHHSRPAREIAAERARERFAHPAEIPEDDRDVPMQDSNTPCLLHTVHSLLQQCLQQVAHSLNNPRVPLLSLSGMSEELSQKMLEHLIKEKQLKPKTLNVFISCHLRKLVLDCYAYTTNELLHAVRLHTNLSHLSLSSCPLVTDAGLQALTALKKLKVLNLSCCHQLTNKCLPFLLELSALMSLNLEDTGVSDAGIQGYLASCPQNLQHLILNRTDVTHQIIPALQGLPSLKSLYLEQTKVCSLSGIQDLKNLEVLDVSRTGIVTDSLLCVSSHPTLTCLAISQTDNVDGDLALQYVKDLKLQAVNLPSRHTTTNRGLFFISNWNLSSLDLSNYMNITDEGVQYIGQIHSLKRLLLTNTKVSDEGMLYLQGLSGLEVLYLDRTLITDIGVQVLSAYSKLLELSLSSTSITSEFLFAGVLNNCQNLARLNLSRTRVTSKGVMNLKLRSLTLLNLDGTRVRPDIAHHIPACPSLTTVTVSNLMFNDGDDMQL
ncbi:hypothetical protein ScPMuIL_015557 [Solemya velum]